MPIPGILDHPIIKLPSEHEGLLYRPSYEIAEWNDMDHVGPWPVPQPQQHFSHEERGALLYALNLLKSSPKLIVEIGVDDQRNAGFQTTTDIILGWKPEECTYIGLDIKDKSHINNVDKHIYTIKTPSQDHQQLYNLMESLGLSSIDFTFVDGEHSINEVLAEWKYWEKMGPNAVMAFHDINYHPGPIAVLDAVDKSKFSVNYMGRENNMIWGVGIVQRIVG